MTTTRVDTEEIASTKSEKFLAVVLTVFILIGAGWAYSKTDDAVGLSNVGDYTSAEQAAVDVQADASDRYLDAQEANDAAKTDLDLARDDLSLAVDQGQPTTALEAAYEKAKDAYAAARSDADTLRKNLEKADKAAVRAEASHTKRSTDGSVGREWASAGLQLLLVGALTLGGFGLIRRVRERESRYLPLGFAVAASGVVMALFFAVDHITDYVDILDSGPIVLSVLGIVATLAAFAALQKYLARRIPRSRVRKGECPFCGFPVHPEAGPHCEGCGRDVLATCASCEGPRRVGSPHCPVCGKS